MSLAVGYISKWFLGPEGPRLTHVFVAGHWVSTSQALYASHIQCPHSAADTLIKTLLKINGTLYVHIASVVQALGPVPNSRDIRGPKEVEGLDESRLGVKILVLCSLNRRRRVWVNSCKTCEKIMSNRLELYLLNGKFAKGLKGKRPCTETQIDADKKQ